jgi:phosphate acetyltransferase
MYHPYVQSIIDSATAKQGRVAIPDAQSDARFLEAACIAHQRGWVKVVLPGSRRILAELAQKSGLNIDGIEIIDPDECNEFDAYCRLYTERRAKEKLTSEQIRVLMHEPIYFACMLHRHGHVDGIASGVYYSTADLARAALKVLGLRPGFTKMSAAGVSLFPHTPLGDNLVFSCGDGAIVPRPTAEELADIAIGVADFGKPLLPETPRVAMLSFSTCGSAKHEEVDRVVRALEIVKQRRPDICIDGEFQLDTALSPYVASKKVKRPSEVAGRANSLVFPDIQSGNIAGKAMAMFGSGLGIGSLFTGINGIVSDHSRGATVEECVINIAFVGASVVK